MHYTFGEISRTQSSRSFMVADSRRVFVQERFRCRFALGWVPPRRLLPAAKRRRSANGRRTAGLVHPPSGKRGVPHHRQRTNRPDWRHPGNANVCFEGCDAQDILGVLQPRLAASTGAACTTGIPEPSHVLRALGLTDAQSDGSIRFSFGRFTPTKKSKLRPGWLMRHL